MHTTSLEEKLNTILNIRYIKIHFLLTFTENTIMPAQKVSAFRGGIGEMMLRANCVRNRKCEICDFEEECIVRRIMYSKSVITPKSVSSGESMGYVFECENTQEEFAEGESLKLDLILFGKNIVYFSQYLHALAMLGVQGIGKRKSHFVITKITNSKQKTLLANGDIYMGNYKVETLKDYVEYRMGKIGDMDHIELVTCSPLTLKYRGVEQTEFSLEALYEALVRRIYMLDCFEGIEMVQEEYHFHDLAYKLIDNESTPITVQRYSTHKQQKMYLNGIKGKMQLHAVNPVDYEHQIVMLKLFLAAEIVHVGKNTSFGFGRIKVC